MESSQILGFFKILTQSVKIALRNATPIASLTTLSILLTSIIFLLYSFSSQTASTYLSKTFITDSTSVIIFILQIIIYTVLSFAITFTFMLSYVAIAYTVGFASVTATAASHTDGVELSLPDLFSKVKAKWRSPFRFRKNIRGSTRSRNPAHYLMLVAVGVGIPVVIFNPNPVTITIASGVGATIFVFHLYASVASELAAVVWVLEDGCEAKEAVEIAETLVEGQRLQGFMVNLFFSILDLIGLLSLWMILGDLGSLSLNLTVYVLFYLNCASVTRIFVNVAYTVEVEMPSSSQSSSLNVSWPGQEYVICNHGVHAEIGTSRTDTNPGRRFYRCRFWKNDDCKFFRWIEPCSPLSQRICLRTTQAERDQLEEKWRCQTLKMISLEEKLNSKTEECESLKLRVEKLRKITLKLKILIFLLCVVIFVIM